MSRSRKGNEWIITKSKCIGHTKNEVDFFIDYEDLIIVKQYTWYIQQKKINDKYIGGKYVCSQFPMINGKRNRKFIHNVIWEYNYGPIPDGMMVDHRDRNPLNNQKQNLRLVRKQDNTKNRSIPQNNTSGVIGVYWLKNSQKWQAKLSCDNNVISFGVYNTKEEAIKTRLVAEKEYYKEFAPQKHLFKEYGIE